MKIKSALDHTTPFDQSIGRAIYVCSLLIDPLPFKKLWREHPIQEMHKLETKVVLHGTAA